MLLCVQMAGLNAALICCSAALPMANRQRVERSFQKALNGPAYGSVILLLSAKRIRTFLASLLAGRIPEAWKKC